MPIVTLYPHCRSKAPKEQVELLEMLNRMKGGYYQDDFFAYKNGQKRKEDLPCFTASACFAADRRRDCVQSLSGFINIDIDAKDNIEHDLLKIKHTLYADKYTFAGHVSVSGNGISLYVKINEEKHAETFASLEKYYAETHGIIIDPATKDITRLRFVVYDQELYINEKAAKYTKTEKKADVAYQRRDIAFAGETDIEYILQQVERDRTDLTASYANWVKIAFALNHEFGPSGEDYFHRLSQFHPKYSPVECGKKYKQCARGGVKIASLFYLVKEAGYSTTSPKTKSVMKSARYIKKSIGDGLLTKEVAQDTVKKIAIDIDGMSEEDASRIAKAALSGAQEDEKEGNDEVYEFICRDIDALKLKKNLIEDCIELNGDPIADGDVDKLIVGMRKKYGSNIVKRNQIEELISSSAKEYNPFNDFVNKNKHRSAKGCIDAVIDSIDGHVDGLSFIEAKGFRRYFIRKWLLGAMSGWNGVYSLLTLIFVGDQGTGKSKWFRKILPDNLQRYFAESKMDGTPDHLTLMTIKAIIMDDEFSGKSRKEAALFKEISSKQDITTRKPYARRPQTYKRVAALCGTTNDESILNDPSGNRRLIPIHVSGVDWDLYDSIDKSDLWIEVYRELEKDGEKWMLTQNDIALLENASLNYKEACPEEEILVEFFTEPKEVNYMTNTQILSVMETKLKGNSIKLTQKKLGAVLKQLGYKQVRKKEDGRTIRVYNIKVKGDYISTDPQPF